jgi:hypothetical protein
MSLTCCGTAVSWADDALPPTTCARLAALFGLDALPDTLSEVATAVETADDGPSPADAVAAEATGAHEVWTPDGRVHLPTFADALAVADVGSGAAAIHSVDPVSGVPVSLRLDDDPTAHSVDPPSAVVSVGVGPSVWRGRRPTRETVRRSLAPHVHLFDGWRSFRRFEAASETSLVALRADRPARVRAVATVLRGLPSDVLPEEFPYGRAEPVVAGSDPGTGSSAGAGVGVGEAVPAAHRR